MKRIFSHFPLFSLLLLLVAPGARAASPTYDGGKWSNVQLPSPVFSGTATGPMVITGTVSPGGSGKIVASSGTADYATTSGTAETISGTGVPLISPVFSGTSAGALVTSGNPIRLIGDYDKSMNSGTAPSIQLEFLQSGTESYAPIRMSGYKGFDGFHSLVDFGVNTKVAWNAGTGTWEPVAIDPAHGQSFIQLEADWLNPGTGNRQDEINLSFGPRRFLTAGRDKTTAGITAGWAGGNIFTAGDNDLHGTTEADTGTRGAVLSLNYSGTYATGSGIYLTRGTNASNMWIFWNSQGNDHWQKMWFAPRNTKASEFAWTTGFGNVLTYGTNGNYVFGTADTSSGGWEADALASNMIYVRQRSTLSGTVGGLLWSFPNASQTGDLFQFVTTAGPMGRLTSSGSASFQGIGISNKLRLEPAYNNLRIGTVAYGVDGDQQGPGVLLGSKVTAGSYLIGEGNAQLAIYRGASTGNQNDDSEIILASGSNTGYGVGLRREGVALDLTDTGVAPIYKAPFARIARAAGFLRGTMLFGGTTTQTTSQVYIQTDATNKPCLILNGTSGQTADIQQWLVNSGTVARVTAAGEVVASSFSGTGTGLTGTASSLTSGTSTTLSPGSSVENLTVTGTGITISGTVYSSGGYKSGADLGISGTFPTGTNFIFVGGILTGTAP